MKKLLIATLMSLSVSFSFIGCADAVAIGVAEVAIPVVGDNTLKTEQERTIVKANSQSSLEDIKAVFGFGIKSTPEYKVAKAKAKAEIEARLAAKRKAREEQEKLAQLENENQTTQNQE